tara:strand:- start:252 stop:1088 length:837 start_codon:yes stop_codon:yes gene_type:complete
MYSIYHIPGSKIGVTNDLKSRVERDQGYNEHEYEVLEVSDDFEFISNREIELQAHFGYKIDPQLYKDIASNNITKLNKMDINVTEQTTTFPCPVHKLRDMLMKELGMSWSTDHGNLRITPGSIAWITKHVRVSQYSTERCYVYNKKFSEYFKNIESEAATQHLNLQSDQMRTPCPKADCCSARFDKIRHWAGTRGLYSKGDTKTQYLKLMEEAGELGRAILKDDKTELVDAIGDMVVVLTNLSELAGYKIEDCIDVAYKVISTRTGKMVNGTFVKNTL